MTKVYMFAKRVGEGGPGNVWLRGSVDVLEWFCYGGQYGMSRSARGGDIARLGIKELSIQTVVSV
jgi:hypothetical protein